MDSKFLFSLFVYIIAFATVPTKTEPAGVSQVGFSIYRDRDDYYRQRNAQQAAVSNPHTQGQQDKVLVTYAVSHPGYQDHGVDLSGTSYDLSSHFQNHHQHVKQFQDFRQGYSKPLQVSRGHGSTASAGVHTPVTYQNPQPSYSDPPVRQYQQQQYIFQSASQPRREMLSPDLLAVIPRKKFQTIAGSHVAKYNTIQDDPLKALNEALDDRYPLQYF